MEKPLHRKTEHQTDSRNGVRLICCGDDDDDDDDVGYSMNGISPFRYGSPKRNL